MKKNFTIGWSKFALRNHRHNPRFQGEPKELLVLIHETWNQRKPGLGRKNLQEVVVVPISPKYFTGSTATVRKGDSLVAYRTQRRRGENWYVETRVNKLPDRIRTASVVLYSRQTLAEEASGKYDWEIVAVLASPVEHEPMNPITMARNFLRQKGGTFAPYTAAQFAEAIWYWSNKATCTKS